MNIEIDKLNLRKLTSLLVTAERRKRPLPERRSTALMRQQAVALAARHGYMIQELFGDQPVAQPAKKKQNSRRKPTRVASNYRDLDNEPGTWPGRGSMPRWLAKKTGFRQNATDFLIPDLANPTARKIGSIGKRMLVKQRLQQSPSPPPRPSISLTSIRPEPPCYELGKAPRGRAHPRR